MLSEDLLEDGEVERAADIGDQATGDAVNTEVPRGEHADRPSCAGELDDEREGGSAAEVGAAEDRHRRTDGDQTLDGGCLEDERQDTCTHAKDVHAVSHQELAVHGTEGQEQERQVLMAHVQSTRADDRIPMETTQHVHVEPVRNAPQNPQYEQECLEFVGDRAQDVVSARLFI